MEGVRKPAVGEAGRHPPGGKRGLQGRACMRTEGVTGKVPRGHGPVHQRGCSGCSLPQDGSASLLPALLCPWMLVDKPGLYLGCCPRCAILLKSYAATRWFLLGFAPSGLTGFILPHWISSCCFFLFTYSFTPQTFRGSAGCRLCARALGISELVSGHRKSVPRTCPQVGPLLELCCNWPAEGRWGWAKALWALI